MNRASGYGRPFRRRKRTNREVGTSQKTTNVESRRAEEKRYGQHETERERDDDVRAGDDRPHDVVHGIDDRLSRETEQRAPKLTARTRRESFASTARELVEREVAAGVAVAQARGRTFAVEIAPRDTRRCIRARTSQLTRRQTIRSVT